MWEGMHGMVLLESRASCEVREDGAAYGPQPAAPKLLDRLSAELRLRHYSRRTEETYRHWIVRFLRFHGCRHPRELGGAEVSAFLTHLAVQEHVAAATQNQALAALLFLYRRVLGIELP